jgi:hypothetical protein
MNLDSARQTRSACCIAIPVASSIEPGTDAALYKLAGRGYAVRRYYGQSDLPRGRSIIASELLAEGFREIMWIDSDILFDPDDVDRLRAGDGLIVGAIYAKKGDRSFACRFKQDTRLISFGASGGVIEMDYVATGFLLTRAVAYQRIREALGLPLCWHQEGKIPLYPYFGHEFEQMPEGLLYLSEDYSFCCRARRVGVKVLADTRIRLGHVGRYPYTWEDVCFEWQLYQGLNLELRHGELLPASADAAKSLAVDHAPALQNTGCDNLIPERDGQEPQRTDSPGRLR